MRLTLAPDDLDLAYAPRALVEGDPLPPVDRAAAAVAAPPTLGELYRAEAPGLLRYFERKTGEGHAAPDLVQETFARLAGVGLLGELINPAAYLQRIARNLLIDRSRRGATHPVLLPLEEWDGEAGPTQEDEVIARDTLRRYEDAIAELPERTRTIFLLQRADDLTYRQIAKRIGVTVWTVEYHMKRAILHLDRMFDDQ